MTEEHGRGKWKIVTSGSVALLDFCYVTLFPGNDWFIHSSAKVLSDNSNSKYMSLGKQEISGMIN